jgi:PAT family beta-lactamase induction signal transducer AmpG
VCSSDLDQLSQALTLPFLNDMGYSADHRGFALATVGVFATIGGSIIGGWVTTVAGLGHSLWVFGFLQVFSNLGYWLIAYWGGPNLPLMYSATTVETLTSGMGTGAFSVLLMRLTEKRFSATQYALFSSLFALPRVLAGPIAGVAADSMGWGPFYLATILAGIPGLLMLQRFVPLGERELTFTPTDMDSQGGSEAAAFDMSGLLGRGATAALVAGLAGSAIVALMSALDTMRRAKSGALDFTGAWMALFRPHGVDGWLQALSLIFFALACGVGAVAMAAVKRRREAVGRASVYAASAPSPDES